MAFTKATIDYLDAGGLIDWQTTAKTSAFPAVSGEGYLVDTTSAAITVTLPTAPSAGDEIIIVDYASNAGTNNITLDPGTLNLRGATDDFVMSTNDQSVRLLYSGATKGWLVTSDTNGSAVVPAPDLTVDFLVVAGGGDGGNNGGGGGGAGGLRTSYGTTSGGGASAESTLTLLESTNYSVTVGASGNDSTFSTITSTAGGSGGSLTANGSIGGSGGGGGSSYSNGASASGGANTTAQGFDGGNSLGGINSPGNLSAGGGGGAAAVGGNGTTYGQGGNGGNGLEVNITGGTGNYYAGGGAGGGGTAGGAATAGTGGGGTAGDGSTAAGNGNINTGGGGGGGGNPSLSEGTGGSGVVILRYPDYYDITVGSGLTTGTLNTAVGANEKYTTFTAGTGSITFGAA